MSPDPVTNVIIVLYGLAVSWAEERNAIFQSWDASKKQMVNGILTFLGPLVVSFLNNFWRADFGDVEGFTSFVLALFGPAVVVWVSSQGAHHIDRVMQRLGGGAGELVEGELIENPEHYVTVDTAIKLVEAGKGAASEPAKPRPGRAKAASKE